MDTREQDPLEFPKSKVEKIFVGDYLIADRKYFTNTFDPDVEDINDYIDDFTTYIHCNGCYSVISGQSNIFIK